MSNELQAMIEARNKRQDEVDVMVEYIEEHKAENPNLRLAVVDASDCAEASLPIGGINEDCDYRRVVKMEGEC